jgi:nicotinate phosphoribosyltransferase
VNQPYLTGSNAALFTDLYELTMAQAYVAEGMLEPATFSLFFRHLPGDRNYLLSCGAEDVADFLTTARFTDADLEYLAGTDQLSPAFIDYLRDFRFSGEVRAVPEGTPVFPQEPLVEVTAPAPEAQIMETWVINQMHVQSVLATKAARIVSAAGGRPVLDFGLRRIHGADGGLKAARAFHIAGVTATSNVLAGRIYGIPLSGTMAHSYVQAHDSELDAFRAFTAEFPETVLLVDTYDTLSGVKKVVALAKELGDEFQVRGIRIDSGDLGALAWESRRLLDEAGLDGVQIFVSGGLDEYRIADLLRDDGAGVAPIDGFGVGTAMGVSPDAPELDIAYKLVEYGGAGRMKLSSGKQSLPGAKQVFRQYDGGKMRGDVLARRDEQLDGEPLLETVVADGRRLRERCSPDASRQHAQKALAALPVALHGVSRAREPYPVTLSAALETHHDDVREQIQRIARAD